MRIVLDKSRCTGLGICESLSPKHFEIDDDGDLMLLETGVDGDELDDVEAAVAGCPTEALRLER